MLAANLVAQMIRDRELEKMSGNAFVSENRTRIFDCRANVKILRFRIVGRDEIEAGRILVVNAGRIHEAARAGRLERFRQLPNLKRPEIIRQGDKIVFLQEADHFCFAAFVRFEEGFLIGRNVALRVWDRDRPVSDRAASASRAR